MLAQHNTATTIREGKGWRTKVSVLFDMSRIVGLLRERAAGFLTADRMKGLEPNFSSDGNSLEIFCRISSNGIFHPHK